MIVNWLGCGIMEREVKRYRLNVDFDIVCVTKYIGDSKLYSISVEMISLPFMYTVERVDDISEPSKANALFKELCQKYREGVKYYEG